MRMSVALLLMLVALSAKAGNMPLFGSQPRYRLAALPRRCWKSLGNLRAVLGGVEVAARIVIKRDDLTGLAFGGNKARKLEFLGRGAATGRNRACHVRRAPIKSRRMTAAAAARPG